MRVILRDVKSGEYYKGGKRWTHDLGAAKDYRSTTRAIEAAVRVERGSLEIVLAFDDPYFNMSLPISRLTGESGRHRER